MENNRYKYNGDDKVQVKVITFHMLPDYILSIDEWNNEGGWKGIISSGQIHINDVVKVIDGYMKESEFLTLEAWEG